MQQPFWGEFEIKINNARAQHSNASPQIQCHSWCFSNVFLSSSHIQRFSSTFLTSVHQNHPRSIEISHFPMFFYPRMMLLRPRYKTFVWVKKIAFSYSDLRTNLGNTIELLLWLLVSFVKMFSRVVSNFRKKSRSSRKPLKSSSFSPDIKIRAPENQFGRNFSTELNSDVAFSASLSTCDSDYGERQSKSHSDKMPVSDSGANHIV